MIRILFALVPALLFSACSGPSVPDTQGGGAVLTSPRVEAVRVPGWMELRDLSAHTLAEAGPPKEPFVRGVWIGGLFLPEAEWTGEEVAPPPRRIMLRGAIGLTNRAFFSESEGLPPAPYLRGAIDKESGAFYPTGRIVLPFETRAVEGDPAVAGSGNGGS